jgi:hypothetical protein
MEPLREPFELEAPPGVVVAVTGKPLQSAEAVGMVSASGVVEKETGEGREDDAVEQVQAQFPAAVAFARSLREVFGPGVRLVYARNERGEELGSRPAGCE